MADNRREETNATTTAPRRGPGNMRGMIGGEKPKNLCVAIKRVINYIGSYKVLIVIVMIFAALSTVFSVLGPKIMGQATTTLAEGLMQKIYGTGGIDFDRIARILLLTLLIYLVSAVFNFFQGWIMTGITQKVAYKLRSEISEKINRLPMKYFESRPYGDVLSRITNDVDTMGVGLNQSVTTIITSITTLIGTVVMMLSISPLMTGISFIVLPVSAVFLSSIVKISQKYFRAQQNSLGAINGMVEESYAGQLVIKAFNKEDENIAEFEELNDALYTSARMSQFLSGLMQPIMMFIGNLGYVAVAVSGGILAIRGTIGVGDIQAFIQYVRNFTQPLQQIAQVINQVQSMAAAAERVFDFLDEPEEVESEAAMKYLAREQANSSEEKALDKGISSVASDVTRTEGNVDFDHVRFGYDKDQTIINDFTAHIDAGKKVAIVGHTGAGKTTIIKLLMRFYDVDDGAILLDGEDIRNIPRTELRKNFGMVLQDTWLFKGSIMENIRYGRLEATDEEVIEAAKAAYADGFIRTLPGGYSMELNEDATNVSQGQKQLLTIARAILSDSPIMILDEATSSVDTRTEERIQHAMDNLMEGRTSFIIAHRLSTIRNADLILVMKEGDIVEQGDHEELLALNGVYAEMYNSQFEN